jgi:peptidoglycan/xylan/chitin deacetylase (PgdA/CDA1 family)
VSSARIILMYHRVASVAEHDDPLQLCVDPGRFREQVELLRSLGAIVPLEEIFAGRRAKGARFAITFDDGYADNALAAAPVLESLHAPATVFVVAGAVGSGRAFWWDRLATLLFRDDAPPRVELTIDGRTVIADTRSPAGRKRAYWAAWSRLRVLPSAQIELVLNHLTATAGDGGPPALAGRPLSEAELRTLVASTVEIGAHTLSHPSLSATPEDEQRREILAGRARLEELINRPVTTFAYPYGDYDRVAVRIVRNGGFRAAVSVNEARVSRFSSRWRLPRYAVRDWDADELEQRLRGWLGVR